MKRRLRPLLLLLVLTPLLSCRDDATEAPSGRVSKSPPAGMRALPAPGKDRLETLKARVEKKPESTQLLSELGDAYFEVKQFREAIPIYARVAELNPQDADAHNDLGLSLFYTGAREEGLASVTKAIEADPTYKHAWLSMGFILLSMERYQEAKAPLKKVKELDPGGRLARSADEFLEMIDEAGDP